MVIQEMKEIFLEKNKVNFFPEFFNINEMSALTGIGSLQKFT